MKDRKKAEEIAVKRMQWLSPLLADGLDAGKVRQLKAQICAQTGLSERTLRRYLAQYRMERFDGLKPKDRGSTPKEDGFSSNIVDLAILLRREVPSRSVSQTIQMLEWEVWTSKGANIFVFHVLVKQRQSLFLQRTTR